MARPIAIIDIGTNTLILLIARPRADSGFDIVLDEARLTRLGEGIHHSWAFGDAAMKRTFAVLHDFKTRIASHDCREIHAIGTAACRNAKNAMEFLDRVRNELGIDVRIISGEEEARLIALAGRIDFVDLPGTKVIMDIGGGSTEFIVDGGESTEFITDNGKTPSAISLPIGSVWLTERFLKSDPPAEDEIAALKNFLKNAYGKNLAVPAGPVRLIACAGTATTLGALHLGLTEYDAVRVHKSILPLDTLGKIAARLASHPLAQRQTLPCLEPLRADVIVAGAHILLLAMKHYGVKEVHISDRGLRYGILYDRFKQKSR